MYGRSMTKQGVLLASGLLTLSAIAAAPASSASVAAVDAAGPLAWMPCTESVLAGAECATLTVLKDDAAPGRGTFDLAVARVKATGSVQERIGSLFFNPGGPGISGLDELVAIASLFPDSVRERFDIVSWDPRGVGRSSGVECDPVFVAPAAQGRPDWTWLTTTLRQRATTTRAACQANNADVVPYIGTNRTVRDLDALRAAVGDEQLTYVGFSYGTRIGYVYAQTFPQHVRAIVESGPVSPNSTLLELAAQIGRSSDTALGMLFQLHPESGAALTRVLSSLQRSTLRLPNGFVVTHWGVRNLLYDTAAYQSDLSFANDVITALDTAINGTDDARTAALTLLTSSRMGEQLQAMAMPVIGMATNAEQFINCIDYPQRPSAAAQDRTNAISRSVAPIVGPVAAGFAMQCSGITVTPEPVPTRFGVNASVPMLIVGSTRDGRTPYVWSTELARAYPSARLVTYVGNQHGAFPVAQSDCVNDTVAGYLASGQLPATDISCPNVLAK